MILVDTSAWIEFFRGRGPLASRVDELLAQYLREGPTADEVQRYQTRSISGRVKGLEAEQSKLEGIRAGAIAAQRGAIDLDELALHLVPGLLHHGERRGDARPMVIQVAPGARISRPGHLGLVGMRERAHAIGAQLHIEGAPGHGTIVTLTWNAADEPHLPG